jgi:hypothetical protein
MSANHHNYIEPEYIEEEERKQRNEAETISGDRRRRYR